MEHSWERVVNQFEGELLAACGVKTAVEDPVKQPISDA
jgi:hypothetical protein